MSRHPALLALAVFAFAALLAAPSIGRAYELKHTAEGDPVRWLEREIRLCVAPVPASTGLERGELERAARIAAAAWSEVPGAPLIVVDTHECELGSLDGTNTIAVREEWGGGRPRLAVTESSYVGRGRLFEADILINGEMPLRMLEERDTESSSYDLPTVLTHEMGHVLGLGESGDRDAVMWPRVSRGQSGRRELAPDDVDAVLALYGTIDEVRVRAVGCAAAPDPRRGGLGFALVFALGLLRPRHCPPTQA